MTSHMQNNEHNISGYIFSVSASLIGVCLTVIGLFQISERLRAEANIGDKLVALDALFFLVSCTFSYLSLKAKTPALGARWERSADVFFLCALLLMVIVGVLVAHALI